MHFRWRSIQLNFVLEYHLMNPRGRPTVDGGQAPFIEEKLQGTRIFNVSTRVHSANGTFGTLLQIDDDQAFLLDGLTTIWGALAFGVMLRVDSRDLCPRSIQQIFRSRLAKESKYQFGSMGMALIGRVANTLRISDSVVQGHSQHGCMSRHKAWRLRWICAGKCIRGGR